MLVHRYQYRYNLIEYLITKQQEQQQQKRLSKCVNISEGGF